MSNLLQIHEPGETPLPHASAAAIGIDLGTTHSVVAVASAGKAETMADAAGATLIPSVVQYGAGAPRVGKIAKAAAARGEAGVVASIKRLMGKSATDVVGQALPYTLDDACEGVARVVVGDAVLTPIEVSAEILRHLRAMAEQTLGHEVTQAVITVPAYFDDAARAATRDAARMAGLTVLRLINEPTAAALAYGLDAQAEGVFAIYDFGGGTFDISILKLEQGVFQVLATAGDTALGGDDIDHAIAAAAMDHAGVSALAPEALAVLLGQCRAAKEALCMGEAGPLTLTIAGAATPYLIDLPALERLMEPLIARTLACAEHAVRDAGLTPHALTGVVLVGGSTRIPLVKAKVAQYFGRPALDRIDPDRVVALGAALQAEALTQGSDTLLLDVIPLSLGLETMGGLVEKLLYRNTPIPAAIAQEFTTYQDGQTAMKIHVLQGEREKVTDCRSLATFTLRGIPPMVAGAARIRVRFEVDADGLLMVSATELTTGTAQEIAVKPSYGLAFEEIERMVAASMEHARADISERLLIEARVGAERLLAEVRAALAADHALLKPGEEAMIAGQVARLEGAVAGASRDRIDHEVMALNGLVGSFAERRMNAAIACALAGRTVDEV